MSMSSPSTTSSSTALALATQFGVSVDLARDVLRDLGGDVQAASTALVLMTVVTEGTDTLAALRLACPSHSEHDLATVLFNTPSLRDTLTLFGSLDDSDGLKDEVAAHIRAVVDESLASAAAPPAAPVDHCHAGRNTAAAPAVTRPAAPPPPSPARNFTGNTARKSRVGHVRSAARVSAPASGRWRDDFVPDRSKLQSTPEAFPSLRKLSTPDDAAASGSYLDAVSSPGAEFPRLESSRPKSAMDEASQLLRAGVKIRLGCSAGGGGGGAGRGGGHRPVSVPAFGPKQVMPVPGPSPSTARLNGGGGRPQSAAATVASKCVCGTSSTAHSKSCARVLRNEAQAAIKGLESRVAHLSTRAREAFARRQRTIAGAYSEQARDAKVQVARLRGFLSLLSSHPDTKSSSHGMTASLDLHALEVEPALAALQSTLTGAARRGLSSVTIVTGRGLHSAGGPRIKPAVKAALETGGYIFSPAGPGSFLVKL